VQWENTGFSLQLPNEISEMEGSKWSQAKRKKVLVWEIKMHTEQENQIERHF